MPSRDQYLIGRLGSYLCASVPHIDSHLRALRYRLATGTLTARQYTAVWHDVDQLLERRNAMRVPA